MPEFGYLFLLLGPSGVGKSTLIKHVLAEFPELSYYPSYTTRAPRLGEVDGTNYFYITQDEFEQKLKEDFFIEFDRPHNSYYYGISKEPLNISLLHGKSFIKETSINALLVLQKTQRSSHIISFFLKPLDERDVKERLNKRNADDDLTRLDIVEKEMQFEKYCQHVISIKHNDISFGAFQIVKILSMYLRKNTLI